MESVTTYKAWMDTKKGFVSTKTIQAKKEEEKKKEEELKRKQKMKEAETVRRFFIRNQNNVCFYVRFLILPSICHYAHT